MDIMLKKDKINKFPKGFFQEKRTKISFKESLKGSKPWNEFDKSKKK